MKTSDILGDKIGFIQLIQSYGDDLTIVNAARVSLDKLSDYEYSEEDFDEVLPEADRRLLKYLAKHNHWSPSSHAFIQVRIKAPISVQRQWFKHNIGCTHSSESTRYVTVKPEFYVPQTLRKQSKSMKQGSEGEIETRMEELLKDEIYVTYEYMLETYTSLLISGVAKEQARDVLPLATYTTWISTISVAAAYRIYKLRTTDGAQFEIGEYAKALWNFVKTQFPHTAYALEGKDE